MPRVTVGEPRLLSDLAYRLLDLFRLHLMGMIVSKSSSRGNIHHQETALTRTRRATRLSVSLARRSLHIRHYRLSPIARGIRIANQISKLSVSCGDRASSAVPSHTPFLLDFCCGRYSSA